MSRARCSQSTGDARPSSEKGRVRLDFSSVAGHRASTHKKSSPTLPFFLSSRFSSERHQGSALLPAQNVPIDPAKEP